MKAPALGGAAAHLPWLSPCAASLVALVRLPAAAAWTEVRADPGAVLLVVRQSAAAPAPANLSAFPALLHDPGVLEAAVRHLDGPEAGFVDWGQPALQPVHQAGVTYARLARSLAERTGRCNPGQAWVAGLLAPLGWLAVCAVAPEQAAHCLHDPDLAHDPGHVQRRWWGLEQAAIARRLARRWRLPRWLAVTVGHLDLPAETAQTLGADPDLFRVVQLAVGLAQRDGPGLHLAPGATPPDCAAGLGLSPGALEAAAQDVDPLRTPSPAAAVWANPREVPLLRDLLLLGAENRRLQHAPAMEGVETDIDHLHAALGEQRAGEGKRLREQKLRALAELAAGAGHEINNPLAVISGQAQYLLNHELDPARKQPLQTIIGQAQRIHHILSELMQFARPPKPQKQGADAATLMREVAASLGELAAQRRVQVTCAAPEHPIRICADPRQIQTALACLLRNAIEAAPADGWARMRVEMPAPDRLEWVVEDSGSGPSPAQREHLFDPFYSGRQAGRGRGLGLPTAWRLAEGHDGDVRYEALADGPTRFVLSLPLMAGGSNGTAVNGYGEVHHGDPCPLAAGS